jgi:rhodanese-related sulfurtransferase
MKNNILIIVLFFFSSEGFSQETLSELLEQHNDNSIPYISVEELAIPNSKPILLDAREPKEYEVSHLKNADCIGYDFFVLDSVEKRYPNKKDTIVVYCSLGIRSETIAKKLKKAGYENVFNLYGGIFEWKNKSRTVYNTKEEETENVHTFNEAWSKWLTEGSKVYEKKKEEQKEDKKKTKKN